MVHNANAQVEDRGSEMSKKNEEEDKVLYHSYSEEVEEDEMIEMPSTADPTAAMVYI